ncbi:LacI family DNA-binding transcriptional regulator [Cohnella hongkongensis]|uniref:LacI family DNA-binding transcriptional regulator n=1 Tax=Cohnella hongkongensis TaxID=178337 RepID=A0ABV9FL10_9BACL
MPKKVTILDVAQFSNVTKSTVSRVINDSPLVNERTKQRVWQAIKELGYTPNRTARSLALGKNHVIGMVVSEQQISDVVLNPFFPTVLKGITTVANQQGYNILLLSLSGQDAQSYTEILQRHTVDGFLILGGPSDVNLGRDLDRMKVPYVFIGKHDPEAQHSFVSTDNEEGGYIAGKHLIDLGHRNIRLMVGEVKGSILVHNVERIAGFRRALGEAGIPFEDRLVVKMPTDMENSYYFLKTYLERDRPSGLILSNEVTSMSCLNLLLDEGIAVPDEISLVSFGDPQFFRNTRPSLTTVSQSVEWLGRTAMEMLLKRVTGGEWLPPKIIRKPEIVLRGSTKKCGV